MAGFASGPVHVVHPFGTPFDDEAGARAMSHFNFTAESTHLGASLQAVAPVLERAKASSSSHSSSGNEPSSPFPLYNPTYHHLLIL